MRAQHLFVVAMAALLATTATQASVEINANPTKNMNCSAGVCAPTAKNAVLNTTDLANMLATSDVKVMTGSGAVTITVSGSFSWTSAHRLTLDAYYNVSFRAPVVVAGQGAVTITTNDGGTGGDLIFFPGAKLDFWDTSSSLTINGNDYTLEGDLKALAEGVRANLYGRLALVRDEDLATHGQYKASPVKPWFGGIFEGLGHTIDHLVIKDDHRGNCGLFKHTAGGGVLRDITLAHVDISGRDGVGALVGNSNGSIFNSSASGVVRGGAYVGGLAGTMFTTMANSSAAVSVYGGWGTRETLGPVGGLVGNASGTIMRSHSTGDVNGGAYVTLGSLVGNAASRLHISESYATGSVTSAEVRTSAGGFVGLGSYATIENSYSLGSVTTNLDTQIGGFIGGTPSDITIKTSYSTGMVTSGSKNIDHIRRKIFLGGFVGRDTADSRDVTDAYWDLDTSGVTDPAQGAGNIKNDPGITGLTDAQLKSGLPAGFDPNIWGQNPSINNGYPYLLNNPPPQ